jgi:hypothetical protein
MSLEFLGEHQVKNIQRLVRVYRVRTDQEGAKTAPPALPDKPDCGSAIPEPERRTGARVFR